MAEAVICPRPRADIWDRESDHNKGYGHTVYDIWRSAGIIAKLGCYQSEGRQYVCLLEDLVVLN